MTGRPAALAALLALAVLLLYAPVRTFEFVALDDDVTVAANPRVAAGLTTAGIRWSLTSFEANNWQPAAWWSHMLDVSLFGLDAGRHHLVSAAWHAANAALLFLLLRALTGALLPAAFAAALFALHPLRVESVAWVAERKDVLSTALWLLATLAWTRWTRRPAAARYVLAAALLALGLMVKPMLVTLPATLLLLDFWPLGRAVGRGRVSWRRLLLEKAPLFGLAAASAVVTFLAQRAGGAVSSLQQQPLAARLANALRSAGWYLKSTLWPSDLAVSYLLPKGGWPAWQVALAAAVLAAATLLALRALRRRPYLAVGWAWYLGTLLPVIGLVQVGSQAMADRFTYVPAIGVAIAAAWGARDLLRRFPVHPALPAAAALALLAALAAATAAQLPHWRTSEALLARSSAIVPGNYLAHNNLGLALAAQGRHEEAAAQYRVAIAAAPAEGYPRFNFGVVLEALGRPEEALREYRAALPLITVPRDAAQAAAGLARLLVRLDRAAEAEGHYERAVALDPRNGGAALELGVLRLAAGRWREAAELLGRATVLDPGNAAARANLGYALAELGRFPEAVREYEAAAALRPGDAETRRNLDLARSLAARRGVQSAP